MTFAEGTPPAQPHGDASSPQSHNSETDASGDDDTCGMTHLASGRTCRLPNRHSDSCDLQPPRGFVAG